jgi:lipopolysaccharide export system permease protein
MVRNPSMVAVAYGLPIGAIVYSLIVLKRSEKQRPGTGLFGKLMDGVASLFEAIRSRLAPARPKGAAS